MSKRTRQYTRRDVLRYGAMAGAGVMIGRKVLAQTCADPAQPIDIHHVEYTGCGVGGEPFPKSPFILEPFTQPLPIPKALKPGWRNPDGTLVPDTGFYRRDGLYPAGAWTVRTSAFGAGVVNPGPEPGHQDALGDRPATPNGWEGVLPHKGTHQLWSSGRGVMGQDLDLPDPLLYHIRLQVSTHRVTSSKVVNIDSGGNVVSLPPGAEPPSAGFVTFNGTQVPAYYLPPSTIYGFNGTFPGPMINAEYGRPVLVRFENDLDMNPLCRNRGDFGAPDWAFLTHLHNGHTAPESDGQPHHMGDHEGGYQPMEWSDNLYLMHPAGGDEREKQSFLWFHDHRMHHTGPNVYKGMVGLMPHYDPVLDPGDETRGLRLPGVRTNNGDGTFDVDYDIPMALYDCVMDDGVTEHRDQHTPLFSGQFPEVPPDQYCGNTHPEWWGQLFLKHYANHGFVGDIFTVNGVAFPTLVVKRRRYRLRFLGASLARQYTLSIRQGTPMPFPGQQGQWNFGALTKGGKARVTDKGVLCMKLCQIASEGGLLPQKIENNFIEVWPAKRREVVVDFSHYIDGKPTASGDVMYLCDTRQMLNGRKAAENQDPGFDPQFCVPMVKIVIDGDASDDSIEPPNNWPLRPAPDFDPNATVTPGRSFRLDRGGTAGGETEWLINNLEFDPFVPLATPTWNTAECWGIDNGGGGWTHPMHIHQEEHHVIWRSTNLSVHKDDTGKEDVVALEPSEQTRIYRRFRTFLGNYVAHCHNLAHEDHNMMFGWTIIPPP